MRELRLILVNGKKLALLYTHTGNFYSDSQHAGSNSGTRRSVCSAFFDKRQLLSLTVV
jgi:hypothetical protein